MSDLISREFAATMLGINDAEQSQLDLLINWISQRAVSMIGREIMSAQRTTLLDGSGSRVIVLPVIPVTAISGIYLDSSRVFAIAEESDAYNLNEDTGIVTLYESSTPKGVATVKVIYTAGYTQSTLPADLKLACLGAISWNLNRLRDKQFGVKNEVTPDGVTRGYEMVLPMETQRVFDAYREARV